MSSETIDDLRKRLFAALDGVKDASLSLDQARVMVDIAQVMINGAKVEVDMRRLNDRYESQFLDSGKVNGAATLGNGIVAMRRHLIKDD